MGKRRERGEERWGRRKDGEEKEESYREVGVGVSAKHLQRVSLPTGGSSIKEYRIAGNKQQVLTRDSNGEVEVWDVLHVSLMICTGASKQYRFGPELSGIIVHMNVYNVVCHFKCIPPLSSFLPFRPFSSSASLISTPFYFSAFPPPPHSFPSFSFPASSIPSFFFPPPKACKEESLGKADLEEEAGKSQGKLYIPNWFSAEVKTGVS